MEGKNLVIEQRFADCRYDLMPGLATELVRVPVDVLFTMGTRASRIVAETVKTTPLVVYSCDPSEHVTRLARGRGNLTGVTCMTTELSPAIHGVVRWRACDLIMRLHEEFGISVSDDTVYRALKDLCFAHVSARPRAYKQDVDAIAAFKKTSVPVWRKSVTALHQKRR